MHIKNNKTFDPEYSIYDTLAVFKDKDTILAKRQTQGSRNGSVGQTIKRIAQWGKMRMPFPQTPDKLATTCSRVGLLLLCAAVLDACLGVQGPPRFGAKGPFGVPQNHLMGGFQGDRSNEATSNANPWGKQSQIAPSLKDTNPNLWRSNHLWIRHFRRHYGTNNTVAHALRAGKPYLPTIRKIFRSQGLPEELAYLPMLESLYDVNANSGSAVGMWQFTLQTARHVGLKVGYGVDERRDWRKATAAAAYYLNQLGARFHYDWALALAAYNCGPGCIEKAIKKQGKRRFFQLRLRKETSEYVPRFVAMLQVAKSKHPTLLLAKVSHCCQGACPKQVYRQCLLSCRQTYLLKAFGKTTSRIPCERKSQRIAKDRKRDANVYSQPRLHKNKRFGSLQWVLLA